MEERADKFGAGESPRIRCAVYTRYSSDLQNPTSSEDQIRNCRAAANDKGWDVLDEYIRSDEELTGRTMVGREGLADLMRLAQQRPRPFDCILIDDTSRLGRYLPDVLRESDKLLFHGVFIYFVSDRLDTREESSRIVHLVKGYGDERYSKDMARKIHRGQEGRIRKGYTAGGSIYGYKNKYLRDPNQKGTHGEARVIGVEQEIIPEQAAVVVRIMEMRAAGSSFSDISKTLNAEGVPAPRRKYKGRIQECWISTQWPGFITTALATSCSLLGKNHRQPTSQASAHGTRLAASVSSPCTRITEADHRGKNQNAFLASLDVNTSLSPDSKAATRQLTASLVLFLISSNFIACPTRIASSSKARLDLTQ